MTIQVNTTYEPYSQEPEYINTNRALIQAIDLTGVTRVADLACGTGLLSELLIERRPDIRICGVDLSEEQIGIAQRHFRENGLLVEDLAALRAAERPGAVYFHHGSADALPLDDGEVELVVIGNAIHLMPDKPKFLREVHRVLAPGGLFVFNSVFFSGTYPPGSEAVYAEWMKQAVMVLEELNQTREISGLPRIARVRGRGDRAFSKGWLSQQGWSDLLETAGFNVSSAGRRNVPISRRGLALVGAYGGLAEVLMSGYPVEIASHCLQQAAERALQALELDEVGRYWLEVMARKNA
jgi:ubiquinone/menaquinone biosynthesis C-methylase UbiE